MRTDMRSAAKSRSLEERVEKANRARFEGRPTFNIGDHIPVEMIEGIWRNKGRTIVDTSTDVTDPDSPILPPDYAIKQDGKVWYILLLHPQTNSAARARLYMGRRGYQVYWPREVVAVIRGRGEDRKFVQKVQPLFPGYALLHAPAAEAPEDILDKAEAWVNGIYDYVQFQQKVPIIVPEPVVARVVQREREGEFIRTEKRSVAVIPSLDWIVVGGLAVITGGPFRSFTGAIEEIDWERQMVKIAVAIFGRATPVDLAFADVRSP